VQTGSMSSITNTTTDRSDGSGLLRVFVLFERRAVHALPAYQHSPYNDLPQQPQPQALRQPALWADWPNHVAYHPLTRALLGGRRPACYIQPKVCPALFAVYMRCSGVQWASLHIASDVSCPVPYQCE